MADAALTKIEDKLKSLLEAHAPLAGFAILLDQSPEVAIDDELLPAIPIRTVGYQFDPAFEQGVTLHTATVDFGIIFKDPAIVISRAGYASVAEIMAVIGANRTLDGLAQDIQEQDLAATDANGKDAGGLSFQVQVQFFTAENDWFTIIGPSGQTF